MRVAFESPNLPQFEKKQQRGDARKTSQQGVKVVQKDVNSVHVRCLVYSANPKSIRLYLPKFTVLRPRKTRNQG